MPSDLHRIWGHRLTTLREEAGLSGRALAAKAGISHEHLRAIERGESAASDDIRLDLARALDVPPGQIFNYNDALESA